MKRLRWLVSLGAVAAAASAAPNASAEPLENRLARAATDYEQRIAAATEELRRVREQVTAERVPLVEATRSLQQRAIALETELTVLRTDAARAQTELGQLEQTRTELRRNLAYLRSTAEEHLQGLETGALPGESLIHAARVDDMLARLQPSGDRTDSAAVVDAMAFALQRIEHLLGGHSVAGEALANGTNTMVEGRFAFIGPEAYFQSHDGRIRGLVRTRTESKYPVVHAVRNWDADRANALFAGNPGVFPADAQGGKALRLADAQGTWLDHVKKGGIVGYIILCLGAIALVISIWKCVDLSGLAVDEAGPVQRVVEAVRRGAIAEAESRVARLRRTTRELMTLGLQQRDAPKSVLEEQLYARILQLRLHHERRLPLLGVIVTASPLLGLLGTVTGMVTTFTLITVFGTGDADKLSSGISEALVTTELGLMVAIPTLVIHGYLGHRVRKQLSMLERYAIEFVTATDTHKAASLMEG